MTMGKSICTRTWYSEREIIRVWFMRLKFGEWCHCFSIEVDHDDELIMNAWVLQELHGTNTKLDFRTSLLKKLQRLTIRGMIMMVELKMLYFSLCLATCASLLHSFSSFHTQKCTCSCLVFFSPYYGFWFCVLASSIIVYD